MGTPCPCVVGVAVAPTKKGSCPARSHPGTGRRPPGVRPWHCPARLVQPRRVFLRRRLVVDQERQRPCTSCLSRWRGVRPWGRTARPPRRSLTSLRRIPLRIRGCSGGVRGEGDLGLGAGARALLRALRHRGQTPSHGPPVPPGPAGLWIAPAVWKTRTIRPRLIAPASKRGSHTASDGTERRPYVPQARSFRTLQTDVTGRISNTRCEADGRKLTEERPYAPTSVHVRRNPCSRSPDSAFNFTGMRNISALACIVFVYRVEARKSAKWCAGLVRMCRYVQYGSRGRQTWRFEGARARG